MKKSNSKKRFKFPRGHTWAAGRPTQNHADKRKKRLKTRKNILIKALEDQEY